MRPVSKKRAVLVRRYLRMRPVFLAENPLCAVCSGPSTEVHHMAGRVGAALLDISRWLAVCRACHHKITVEPAWAIHEGWSLPRVGAA